MIKDIGFLVALLVGIASSVASVVLLWHGKWIEGGACGLAFAACLIIAFWLAMTSLLEDGHL